MDATVNIIVLGAGLVGRAMVLDLAEDIRYRVTAVDIRKEALGDLPTQVQTLAVDLTRTEAVSDVVREEDLVICAVPGLMGFQTLESVIRAGKPVVDISFFPEDPFALDNLAREKKVSAIVDCGVAPGLCNILAADAASRLDEVSSYCCFVGGLPVVRKWPFEYAAVFSPSDVLEEYLRPARVVEGGKVVVKPALSERENLDFPGVGTLEAFNTDGLRTMIDTFPAREMHEKTMRYPGHAEIMSIFRSAGFLDKEPMLVGDVKISPFDLSAKLLRHHWRLPPGEEDFTLMRVEVTGTSGEQPVFYRYDLLDRFDGERKITSMARTTGYTATLVARMLAEGKIVQKGILPPEKLGGEESFFSELMRGYEQRGIRIHVEQGIGAGSNPGISS